MFLNTTFSLEVTTQNFGCHSYVLLMLASLDPPCVNYMKYEEKIVFAEGLAAEFDTQSYQTTQGHEGHGNSVTRTRSASAWRRDLQGSLSKSTPTHGSALEGSESTLRARAPRRVTKCNGDLNNPNHTNRLFSEPPFEKSQSQQMSWGLHCLN